MGNTLEIIEQVNKLEIVEEQVNLFQVVEAQTNILTEYIPGPPGADGTDGGGTPRTEFLIVTDPNITSHVLENPPVAGSLQVFLNGLREWDYSLSGDTVDFNLDLGAGDRLTFDYLLGD